ncbi:sigma-70 family RNA polymerase sigma factor [Marmoricola sp. RAF53]|uniref:sigma-70 family RNA polymerase sigma factor n=1 Tax=Marmoricola sp. RAF53 TaxID=3233059 RepID=UPI003F993544
MPIQPSTSDRDLIARVRARDDAAYEELFLRHRGAALRLARRLTDHERAEDLCSEAFARILALLRRGQGPELSFRAYLLTTVRTLHLNALRNARHERTLPDSDLVLLSTPVSEGSEARFDAQAIARAFQRLPERWRQALWLTAVEGLSHEDVGRELGIDPNAVSSLTFRARAGLRQAYLAEHLRSTGVVACARIVALLPGHLSRSLTPRRRALVTAHLRRCARCAGAAGELADVDRRLGA